MGRKNEASPEDLKQLQNILVENYNNTRQEIRSNYLYWREQKPKTVEQRTKEAQARVQEARAEDAEGDIKLKKKIARVIISILIAQTVLIFYIAISQGLGMLVYFNWPTSFHLEEWSFRILISGTLVETYYLMRIVVTYLFPKRDVS